MFPKICIKNAQISKKSEWRNVLLGKLPNEIQGIKRKDFELGHDAVYLHTRIYLSKIEFTYYLNLDIESPEAPGHSDIGKNIQVAQDFLIFLTEKELTEGLTIFLTGNGFRFCWPWIIPLKFKRAFISWIQKTECIDSAPQKNNAFLRGMGYRGNRRQGKTKDCHIHKLNNPEDLMGLNEEKYLQLTKGKPDYDQCMSWLDMDILPDREIPPEWEIFLQNHKGFTDLQGTIFNPEFQPDSALYDSREKWEQIYAFLDAQGISYREKHSSETKTLLLKTCPVCDRKNCAYVTMAGRLKCWHANSCSAGAKNEKGGIIGLPPAVWITDFEETEVLPPPATGNFSTIEAIRDMIGREVVKPGDKFLGIDPGVGKTHTTIKAILPSCVLKPHGMMNVFYSGPTHAVNKEVYEKALGWASPGTNIYQILGRNKKNCHKSSVIEEVVRRGFSPIIIVCMKCRKENPGKKCKHDAQFENIEIGAGYGTVTHQKLKYMDLDQFNIDTLILDESPLSAFFTNTTVSLDDILFFATGYQGKFFEKLVKAILSNYAAADPEDRTYGAQNRIYTGTPPQDSNWEDSLTLWEQAGVSDDERDQLCRHLAAYCQLELESFSRWMCRIYKDGVNFKALTWLLCALGEKNGTTYIKINLKPMEEGETEKNRCKFVRISMDLPKFTGQIISLDGTSTKQENDAIFKDQNRDFELIEGRISLDTCQKNLVRRGMGKMKAQKLKDSPKILKSLLIDLIKLLRPQDHKILIATHQLLEGALFTIAKELLPDKELGIIHFYGNRGINGYSDYDAIICFGAPGTAQSARLDEAMTLFPDSADRKKWYQAQADAELIQTVHRIRPVNGGKNIILLGRRWLPELGALNCEIDVRKGSDKVYHSTEKAYNRIKKFYKAHRFINIEMAYALGIGHVDKKNLIEMVMNLVLSPGLRHLYIYYYIGDVTLETRPQKLELILFKRKAAWTELCKRLQDNFVGQAYQNKVHSQWTSAFGSLNAVKEFSRATGLKFNPENWRKKDDAQ